MLGVAHVAAAEHKLLESEVAGRETELARLRSALLEQEGNHVETIQKYYAVGAELLALKAQITQRYHVKIWLVKQGLIS